ncbi:MAG TPA: GNAT family N-acetyltransferase [Gemmatimonadales bacterium]|nr:GNAT family N-acetyltransferase [Gemmatimonadales bacterium]
MRRKQSLDISRLKSRPDAEACARLMASSEPWVTLGRSYEASLRIVGDSSREVYVARDENGPAGFLILCMTGAFVGYIQTVLVHPDRRGQGIGSRLVRFAEDRIFRDSPNIFMCVSSFNSDARRLYQRLGYQVVGELTDYLVRGYSEILLRKTVGPINGYESRPQSGMAPGR